MALKTERVHLVVTPDWVERVDEWRYTARRPSRADAVRELVELGLQTKAAREAAEAAAEHKASETRPAAA